MESTRDLYTTRIADLHAYRLAGELDPIEFVILRHIAAVEVGDLTYEKYLESIGLDENAAGKKPKNGSE